jgi:uncharacterized membrane protein
LARLETFADGVFAIAATLLVLDLHDLAHWQSFVAYAVSFVTIGIMWMNHHLVMTQVGRIDRRFMVATIGLLMCIAFVPFPTRLLARDIGHAGARDAALAYGFTLTTTAMFFSIVWFYASIGGRLLHRDCDPRVVRGISRSYLPGIPLYLTATLIAFASPTASAVLFLAIAALYVFESSVFGGSQTAD